MCKLLSANFSRLFINRDLRFTVCLIFLIIYSAFFLLCKQISVGLETPYWEDKEYFNFSLCIQTLVMFFSVIFLRAEYSSGAVRNKIITGAKRTNIYLSNIITVFSAALIMMAVWFSCAALGAPSLRTWEFAYASYGSKNLSSTETGCFDFIWYIIVTVMFLAAVASIVTFINMLLSDNSSAGALISFILFSVMIFGTLSLGSGIDKPGFHKYIYQIILDFLPTGQGIQMFDFDTGDYVHIVRMLLSSAFITVSTTAMGIILFKRKNIR